MLPISGSPLGPGANFAAVWDMVASFHGLIMHCVMDRWGEYTPGLLNCQQVREPTTQWVHPNFLGEFGQGALATRLRVADQRLLCTSPREASIRVAPSRLQL
jgi:hypothetical protein